MAAADPAWAVKEVVAATCQAAVTDQERAAAGALSLAHWMTMLVALVAARASIPAPKKTAGRPGPEAPEPLVRRTLRRMAEPSL